MNPIENDSQPVNVISALEASLKATFLLRVFAVFLCLVGLFWIISVNWQIAAALVLIHWGLNITKIIGSSGSR
jgi:hypothetical protein